MATIMRNLSDYKAKDVPEGDLFTIGIVVSEWNPKITDVLLKGAVDTLKKHGVESDEIIVKHVPGTVELTYGAKMMIEYANVDAVICLGCVIQGETKHFDYVCQSVTHGITELNVRYDIPVIFGVLTTNNEEQAADRSGGKHGNKGVEAAITALKMANLRLDIFDEFEDPFFGEATGEEEGDPLYN